MSEVRADVSNAFEDPTGVYFHADMTGRTMKVHILAETLKDMGSGMQSGEYAKFVQENEAAMQRLVDEAIERGWDGPLTLIV